MFDQKKIFGQKNIWRNFGYKKYLGQKKVCQNKMLDPNKLGPKSLVDIRSVTAEILLKKLGPKSLVKIGSVTAEIILIWTYVARTYVA